jgi:hypothetical protein
MQRSAAAMRKPLTHASPNCLGRATRRENDGDDGLLGSKRLLSRAGVAAIGDPVPRCPVRQLQAIASAAYDTPPEQQGNWLLVVMYIDCSKSRLELHDAGHDSNRRASVLLPSSREVLEGACLSSARARSHVPI